MGRAVLFKNPTVWIKLVGIRYEVGKGVLVQFRVNIRIILVDMYGKSFFDRAPKTIIFWENFGAFFLGYELFFDDQTLMVFRCNWKVDSSVKKTLSKNPGKLNCLQKSSRLIFCC